MIVKNEEANLPACLGGVADLVDEIVIVDTGSTDRTREVAAGFGARVVDFPWQDSFAAARNEGLRHATGQWIFWMDADDRLDEKARMELRKLFAELPDVNVAYMMHCVIVQRDAAAANRVVDHVRLFRNHPKIRWCYRIHEQILPAVRASGGELRRTDIVIQHVGYQDAALRQHKRERNFHLLQLEIAEHPNDPVVLFNYGRSLQQLNRMGSLQYWQKSLKLSPPEDSYIVKLYSLLAQGYHQAGRRSEMLATCLAGLARFPDEPELLFMVGTLLHEQGDLGAAAACLERLLTLPPAVGFAVADDPTVRGFKARHLLASIYCNQKQHARAEALLKKAVTDEPEHPQPWLGLGQLYLQLKRWDDVDEVLGRLDALPQGAVGAAVLRAMRHAVRQEYPAARQLLEETVARFPQAIEPWILLSRVLCNQNQDLAAAERAVRTALALDPGNMEARRYLAKLQSAAGALPVLSAPERMS